MKILITTAKNKGLEQTLKTELPGAEVIFEPNKTPQYLKSVNTPDYDGDENVIINPDLSIVVDVPIKYWKRDKDNVVEMSEIEKQVIISAGLEKIDIGIENYEVDVSPLIQALVKLGVVEHAVFVTKLKEIIYG